MSETRVSNGPFPYMATPEQVNDALRILGFDPCMVHSLTIEPPGIRAVMFYDTARRDMYDVTVPNWMDVEIERNRNEGLSGRDVRCLRCLKLLGQFVTTGEEAQCLRSRHVCGTGVANG